MKKKTGLLALLLLACLMLSGCHGKNASSAFVLPDRFDTDRTYEISFWAKNDTNMTQVQIYKDAIAGFEAAYPNVKVNLRLYTDYGRIYNDVITNIATNTTPNVCITYPDHIATYLNGGTNTVIPLTDILTDAKYGLGGSEVRFDGPTAEEVVPKFLSECRIGSDTYALPFMRSTEAVYVNKTFVEKLGYTLPETLTWDFVWEVSEAATAKDENGNFYFDVTGNKLAKAGKPSKISVTVTCDQSGKKTSVNVQVYAPLSGISCSADTASPVIAEKGDVLTLKTALEISGTSTSTTDKLQVVVATSAPTVDSTGKKVTIVKSKQITAKMDKTTYAVTLKAGKPVTEAAGVYFIATDAVTKKKTVYKAADIAADGTVTLA